MITRREFTKVLGLIPFLGVPKINPYHPFKIEYITSKETLREVCFCTMTTPGGVSSIIDHDYFEIPRYSPERDLNTEIQEMIECVDVQKSKSKTIYVVEFPDNTRSIFNMFRPVVFLKEDLFYMEEPEYANLPIQMYMRTRV